MAAAAPYLYIGAEVFTSDNTYAVYILDKAGNTKLAVRQGFGPNIYGIVADADGFFYSAGQPSLTDGYTTRKYDSDGNQLWAVDHGGDVYGITLDSSGNIYTVGDAVNNAGEKWYAGTRTGFYTTRKYNNDGVLQFSIDHGESLYGHPNAIRVSPSGQIYTVGRNNYGETYNQLKAYNSSGVLQWEQYGIDQILCIALDSSGNIFVGGYAFDGSNHIKKYSSSGSLLAEGRPGTVIDSTITGIAIDSADDVYMVYANTLKLKLGNDLSLIWQDYDSSIVVDPGDYRPQLALGITLDADDNIYICNFASGFSPSWHIRAYDKNGEWIFDATLQDGIPPTATESNAFCIFALEPKVPGLRLPVNIGQATTHGYDISMPPALPLALQLGIPTTRWDTDTQRHQQLYRCYLTGTTWLELPIESITCYQSENGGSLSVVCKNITYEQIAEISERTDGDIIIKRGFSIGQQEQYDVFLVAIFTEFDSIFTTTDSSITLTGTLSAPTVDTKEREIQQISYRTATDGIRRIRCSIDTYLCPGDTALLGGEESLVISSMTYYISPDSAFMEISEST